MTERLVMFETTRVPAPPAFLPEAAIVMRFVSADGYVGFVHVEAHQINGAVFSAVSPQDWDGGNIDIGWLYESAFIPLALPGSWHEVTREAAGQG